MKEFFMFVLTGFFSSLIVLGWQCYKDTPWENFVIRKFLRTLFIAPLVSIVVYMIVKYGSLDITNLGVLLLFTISLERIIGEVYKGFIRKGSHKEYEKLFERLKIHFDRYFSRVSIGIIVSGILTIIVIGGSIKVLQFIFHFSEGYMVRGIVAGLLGGLLSAVGGAIKDSQFEGFKVKKFIRSPLVGILGGIMLIRYTHSVLVLLLAVTGFERVVVECYKTFIQRQVRGIFENQKAKYPYWFKRRWIFLGMYLIGVAALIVFLYLN